MQHDMTRRKALPDDTFVLSTELPITKASFSGVSQSVMKAGEGVDRKAYLLSYGTDEQTATEYAGKLSFLTDDMFTQIIDSTMSAIGVTKIVKSAASVDLTTAILKARYGIK